MARAKAARRPAPRSRRPVPRPPARAVPAVVPGSLPKDASRFPLLLEPPHSHVVCRVCGRIASVPLDTDGSLLLERLARQRPDGWTVDLISFSLTGTCERCGQRDRPRGG